MSSSHYQAPSSAFAYQRIASDLSEQIRAGTLASGEQLPSEAELARIYSVSRMTIRHAITGLIGDGRLVRRHGVGTFVSGGPSLHRSLNRLRSFTAEMAHQGRQAETRVFEHEVCEAPADVRVHLLLTEGASVVHIARLRLVDEQPAALQNSWIPYGRCPGLARDGLPTGSLYTTLEARYGIVLFRAEERITPITASEEQARMLEMEPGAPLLIAERTTFDDHGKPVEHSHTVTNLPYWVASRLERDEHSD